MPLQNDKIHLQFKTVIYYPVSVSPTPSLWPDIVVLEMLPFQNTTVCASGKERQDLRESAKAVVSGLEIKYLDPEILCLHHLRFALHFSLFRIPPRSLLGDFYVLVLCSHFPTDCGLRRLANTK